MARSCICLLLLLTASLRAQEDDAKREEAEARIQELNARVEQLYSQGKYADAREAAEESLALAEKALGLEHPDTAQGLNNLAELLRAMGDLKGARPLLERALAIREKVLGPEHPDTAQSLNNLAGLLKAIGDLKRARPLLERALAISEKALGPEHPYTAWSLNSLAYLHQAMGDLKGARPLYERAWSVNRKELHTLLPAMSSEQRRSLLSIRAIQLAYLLAGFRDEPGETFEAALAWKGAALRASAAAERLPDNSPAEVREASVRLADARRALVALYYGGKQPRPGEPSIREQAEVLQKEIGAEETLLGDKAPGLAARAFLDAGLDDVRKALPEGAALLDVLENCGNMHAWVVRREGEPRYFDLGKASDLEPLAARLREALENDDEKGWKEAGGALLAKLGSALSAAIEGTKTLYLSPDGTLATIPWGLLPDGEGFLIERLALVQVHGGAGLVMAARTAEEKRGEGLLAVGDVDYSGIEGGPPRLPATKAEVEEVTRRFEAHDAKAPRRVLTGKDATKSAFGAGAGKARYVHVATHGFFDLEHLRAASAGTRGFAGEAMKAPLTETEGGQGQQGGGWNPLLLSGIVLAKGEKEDGWLTAEELQSLDLRGVDLMVLSACETGRGELAAGEGVLGLSRALAVAGARGFMLSLWKVPDAETRELMGEFYTGLWCERHMTAEEALRAVQLRVLSADREAKRFRPSAWGAWLLIR